jgi:hypothetical protein
VALALEAQLLLGGIQYVVVANAEFLGELVDAKHEGVSWKR